MSRSLNLRETLSKAWTDTTTFVREWIVNATRLCVRYVMLAVKGMASLLGILFVCIGVMLLGVGGLSGCARNAHLTGWEISLSDELRSCEFARLPPYNPDADEVELQEAAQTHSIEQTANLVLCDAKRETVVGLVDSHNRRVRETERPRWWIW